MSALRLRLREMTFEQKAAYWKRQARKWENRTKDLLWITDGRHGDELKADLDELAQLRLERAATRTDNTSEGATT